MIRKAKETDAKDILHVNTYGWQNTYKGIFPDTFLAKLDTNDTNFIGIQIIN